MKVMKKLSAIAASAIVTFAALTASLAAPAQGADLNGSISPSGVSFTENSATPAFTFTTPALATSSTYDRMSLSISAGDPPNFTYWSVIQSCPTSPGATLSCGISAITVTPPGSGAAAVTGVTAAKLGDTISLKFPSPLYSGSIISVSFDIGAFTVGAAGTYKLVLSPVTANVTDDRAVLNITSVTGGGTPTPSPAPAPVPDPAADSATAATLANTASENSSVEPMVATLLLLAAGGALIITRRIKA